MHTSLSEEFSVLAPVVKSPAGYVSVQLGTFCTLNRCNYSSVIDAHVFLDEI